MIINSAQVAPNPVNAGGSLYISVEIQDPDIWLLDSSENFLIDNTGAFLQATEG